MYVPWQASFASRPDDFKSLMRNRTLPDRDRQGGISWGRPVNCDMMALMAITVRSADRTSTLDVADERAALTAFLDHQRDTLAWKCSGLTDDQLALRVVEPSRISLLGLLRHLTDVERARFQSFVAGEQAPSLFGSPENIYGGLDSHANGHADLVRERFDGSVGG
jgi:hypothetical protein